MGRSDIVAGGDPLTVVERSERMRRVHSADTSPEMRVRRLAHGLGYRFRLHDKRLPGRPDMVFRSRRKVIFVHGCFWHLHDGCRLNRQPASRREYWGPKLARNAQRDRDSVAALVAFGWSVLVVWECETKAANGLRERLLAFLGPTR
jgi:DNA mismatch endonuclease, patch repair protein